MKPLAPSFSFLYIPGLINLQNSQITYGNATINPAKIEVSDDGFSVNGRSIRILADKDPENLPWSELDVDIVVESTGLFTNRSAAKKHLKAGAKKVLISAPAADPDVTLVLGVNDDIYNTDSDHIISNASCTTNCLAPIAKVLHKNLGIERGVMTTIHSFTNDQQYLTCLIRTCVGVEPPQFQ